MAWKATGTERGKSFKVYRDLEAKHDAAIRENVELRAEVDRKNGTIKLLAAEMAKHLAPENPAVAAIIQTFVQLGVASTHQESLPRSRGTRDTMAAQRDDRDRESRTAPVHSRERERDPRDRDRDRDRESERERERDPVRDREREKAVG